MLLGFLAGGGFMKGRLSLFTIVLIVALLAVITVATLTRRASATRAPSPPGSSKLTPDQQYQKDIDGMQATVKLEQVGAESYVVVRYSPIGLTDPEKAIITMYLSEIGGKLKVAQVFYPTAGVRNTFKRENPQDIPTVITEQEGKQVQSLGTPALSKFFDQAAIAVAEFKSMGTVSPQVCRDLIWRCKDFEDAWFYAGPGGPLPIAGI